MDLARRSILNLGFAAVAAPTAAQVLKARPPTIKVASIGAGRRDYRGALAALGAYAALELKGVGLPGMTLSMIDAEGFSASMTLGYADLELGKPVEPSDLFQIGSISKAFASLCLFTFAEEGVLDLDAPLRLYLPDAALPPELITVAQVMSHCAGLPDAAPIFPRAPDGRLWCGFSPGSKFSYSNTGYDLLGHLIARLGGVPHPEVIRTRVLKPLGLEAMLGVIEDENRSRFATGYSTFSSASAPLTGAPLAAGPWTQMDDAAGSLSATAETMTRYLAFLVRLGRGDATPLFGAALARRFATPAIAADDFGPKAQYGYGLATVMVGNQPCLHHTGGMITFTSSFHVDVKAGIGCFASVNASLGDYRPRRTTAYAIALMRAVQAGAALPATPDPLIAQRIATPEVYVGRYEGAAGESFVIEQRGPGLELVTGTGRGRLEPAGPDTLMTDHPQFSTHLLDFNQKDKTPATAVWWNDALFQRSGLAPVLTTVVDPLVKLAGHYLSNDPWIGDATLLARGDSLVLEGPRRADPKRQRLLGAKG